MQNRVFKLYWYNSNHNQSKKRRTTSYWSSYGRTRCRRDFFLISEASDRRSTRNVGSTDTIGVKAASGSILGPSSTVRVLFARNDGTVTCNALVYGRDAGGTSLCCLDHCGSWGRPILWCWGSNINSCK
jgi:hypothetical protein